MDVPELFKPVDFAIPAFIVLMMAELLVIQFSGKGRFETRDGLTSLLMGAGNVVSGVVFGGLSAAFLLLFVPFGLVDWGWSIPAILLCFLIDDLRYYWYHRFAHEVRWFWTDHIIHHSSQHYNLSTALRQPWTSFFTGAIVFRLPLVLLGFHPAMIAFVGGFNLIYQFWIHTELIRRFPAPIEWFFNTPSHHRVHHGRNARYLDANYAGTLIIWDRLFGTFVPELDDEPVRYGLTKNLNTFNPIRVATHEWMALFTDATRPGLTLAQRFGYVFGPPGWSHDGSRQTAADLKADYVRRHPEHAGSPGLPAAEAPPAGVPAK